MRTDKMEYLRQSDGVFPGYLWGTGLIPRFLSLVLLFLALAGAAYGQATPDGTASLTPQERQWLSRHDKEIRIGITVIPPQIIRNNGGYQGLSIDYIRLMERKLGCRFKLVPFATWNEVIQAAKMRRIDVIFAAQKTPDRLTYLLFTEPYIELPNMIVVRKDRQGAHSLKEMKGWSVAVSEGSAVQEFLQKEFAYLDLRPVQDELTGLMKVSLGEVDAMVVEISRASYYIEKAGILNLRVAGEAGLTYRLRFAVRNDWPVLCGILDKGLSSISGEERRKIGRRWIIVGEKGIFASRAFRISLAAGVGAIALAVIVVVAWNRTLRRTVRQRTSELQQELAERRHAEESLAKSEARFRRLAENARDVIYRMSLPDGAYEYISPAVKELSGYAPEEFYGNPRLLREFIHPQWRAYIEEEWSRLLDGEMPPTYEYQIIHRSGDVRWVNQRNIMVRDEGGHPVAIEGIVTDITDRKRSEEELFRLNEELRSLNAELEARVKERTAELEEKNAELQRTIRLFVGRELRMVELKEKIRKLEERVEKEPRLPDLP